MYNGTGNQIKLFYDVFVKSGVLYEFKLSALNFNGESILSDALLVRACAAPSKVTSLQRVSGDETKITLRWLEPEDDGGCPITGYQLFRNSGGGI